MKNKIITVIAFSILIVGCANNRPIIDTKGVDMRGFESDLAECQQYAQQVETGKDTAVDAGLGAAFGWAISAVTGGDGQRGASIGAVTGGAKGLSKSANTKEQVIRNCLIGRGYRVLN